MKFNDSILGVAVALFGVAVFFQSQSFPKVGNLNFGAALFPSIIGIGFTVLGLVLIWRGAKEHITFGGKWAYLGEWAGSPRYIINMLMIPVAVIAYILFAQRLGFFIISFLIVFCCMIWLRVHLLLSLVVSIFIVFIVDVLFSHYLLVPLPYGIFQPLAWVF